MAATLPILVFSVNALLHVLHVGTSAKLNSIVVSTEGLVEVGTEEEIHLGLVFLIDKYNQNDMCIEVLRVMEENPKRKVDEFSVKCGDSLSENKDMVIYGKEVHIKTNKKKALWAVFAEDGGCTRRKYSDHGGQLLGKEEEVLTKDECMKVLHGESHAQILAMEIQVEGFVKSSAEKKPISGLTIFMYTFNKDSTCIKVMRMYQNYPLRKVEELTVTCDEDGWSDTEGMVSYGVIVHIQTEENKAEWAVFVMDDGCVQRAYTDNEFLQLGKKDRVLTMKECEQVLREKQPIEEDLIEEEEQGDNISNELGVISMDDINTEGYETVFTADPLRYRPQGIRVDSEDRRSESRTCVRIAKISVYGLKVENMKITCDLNKGRQSLGHFQFGSAFTFRPGLLRNSYVGLYNMRDGSCIKRTYSVKRGKSREVSVTNEDKTKDDECKGLANGDDMISERKILDLGV